MTSFVYMNGFHFIGKFTELIEQLSMIENKHITVREYIQLYRWKLN